jgi:hypothetical protein
MKRLTYILALILMVCLTKAQTFPWAKSGIGPGGYGEGLSVCTDLSGNVFITGIFQSPTVTFGSYTLTNSGSGANMYLVKYDSNGNVLWAKSSNGSGTQQANSVSADAGGNVYITGYFNVSPVSFGTYTLTNTGGIAAFLVKYDPNGNVLWAKSSSGSGQAATGRAVSTDAGGNVYISGYFAWVSTTFGSFTLPITGTVNVFLAKYDTNGNVLWAKSSTGTGNDYCYTVNTDAVGNTCIGGWFNSPTISFGTYTLTNTGSDDVFLAKYDTNGNVLWAKGANGSTSDRCNSIGTDAAGNVFTTGVFGSPTITFGTYTLTNSGGGDMFLVKYSPNGNVLWAKSSIGVGSDEAYSLSTYSAGVFVTGSMGSNGGFGGGSPVTLGTFSLTPPTGSTDPMYIALYDLNGNVICAKALASGADDQNAVSADQFGNAYITGDFKSNPFMIGSTTLTLTGSEDVFVAKFNCQPDVTGIENINKDLTAKLYPNPNNGFFTLQFDNTIENGELILFNSLGQQVHEQRITQGENKIITNGLARGLYHYTILEREEKISNGKIAIE